MQDLHPDLFSSQPMNGADPTEVHHFSTVESIEMLPVMRDGITGSPIHTFAARLRTLDRQGRCVLFQYPDNSTECTVEFKKFCQRWSDSLTRATNQSNPK